MLSEMRLVDLSNSMTSGSVGDSLKVQWCLVLKFLEVNTFRREGCTVASELAFEMARTDWPLINRSYRRMSLTDTLAGSTCILKMSASSSASLDPWLSTLILIYP